MKNSTIDLANAGQYRVQLVGDIDAIRLTNIPNDPTFDSAWFSLFDNTGAEMHSQRATRYKGELGYTLQYVTPGNYKLQVLQPTSAGSNLYTIYLRNIPVTIENNRMVYFEYAPVYEHNVKVHNQLKKDITTLENYKKLPSDCNADIIKKSFEITKWCFNDYSKTLAVHDWIASNIYYDMDSFLKHSIDYSKLGKATPAFSNKLAVCSGYSALAVAMLRSLGLPAFSQSCYALGLSTTGKWTINNIHQNANHSITMVYLQKRWLIMDITWDSNNKYQNGTFQQNGQISHRYFDPTLQFISGTHKLC